MADAQEIPSSLIESYTQGRKNDAATGLKELFEHPIVKEFGIPILKQQIKKEFGIDTHEREIMKKPAGRFIYAIRDFVQGTWWVLILTFISLGGSYLLLKWLAKFLGV